MVDFVFATIWVVLMILYIIVGRKDAKSNNEVKKEITLMNELLLEQNTQLREQNKYLNMAILSVCNQNIKERSNKEKGEKTHEEKEAQKTNADESPQNENGNQLSQMP